jgi:hypothetical protein
MLNKNAKKQLSTLVSVTKEMAKPRISRSAQIAELKLDTTRTKKSFPPKRPSQPEKAQIRVDGADRAGRHRKSVRFCACEL